AGVGALLRQLYPESTGVSAQQIRLAMMATSSRAATPDNLVGNGLLNALEARQVLAWGLPPARLAAPPPAAKGTMAWRSGRVVPLPWSKGLDLSAARVWDVRGRPVPVKGETSALNGDVNVVSRRIEGSGIYVLKIPLKK